MIFTEWCEEFVNMMRDKVEALKKENFVLK